MKIQKVVTNSALAISFLLCNSAHSLVAADTDLRVAKCQTKMIETTLTPDNVGFIIVASNKQGQIVFAFGKSDTEPFSTTHGAAAATIDLIKNSVCPKPL